MKRIIAAILAIILLASLVSVNAESTSKAEGKFKPTFVKTIGKNQSASQWMLTDSNRALFAVLFAFDFMNEYVCWTVKEHPNPGLQTRRP